MFHKRTKPLTSIKEIKGGDYLQICINNLFGNHWIAELRIGDKPFAVKGAE